MKKRENYTFNKSAMGSDYDILFECAYANNFESFKNALVRGANPNSHSLNMFEPSILCSCLKYFHPRYSSTLVEHGAKINVEFEDGSTVLSNLFYCDFDSLIPKSLIEIFKAAVAIGADINKPNAFGYTVLRHALKERDVNLVNYLLDCGASITIADMNGDTIMYDIKNYYAETPGEIAVIQRIIELSENRSR